MKRKNQARVVQTLDHAIQRINIGETNRAIQWMEIYPADSAVAPFEHLILSLTTVVYESVYFEQIF